jgi:hypothetical protein
VKTALLVTFLAVAVVALVTFLIAGKKHKGSEDVLFNFSNTEFFKLQEKKEKRKKLIRVIAIVIFILALIGLATVYAFYALV